MELPTTLLRPISHVVIVGTDKQVCRIDATPVIAGMADEHAIWNRAVGKFKDQAMSAMQFAERFVLPVSVDRDCPSPVPTRTRTARLVHQLPRIVLALALRLPVAGLRTPFAASICGASRNDRERLAAYTACAGNWHNKSFRCKGVEKVGRGSTFPLVSQLARPAQALQNVIPIIPRLIVMPILATPLGEE